MDKRLIPLSKLLSLVLRHDPAFIGIILDDAGWTAVSTLLLQLNAHGFQADRAMLDEIVETNPKKRFALNDTGDMIRANQGHSVDIALGLMPAGPPAILYHGTAEKFVDSIRQGGLIRGTRQHVHLSTDMITARSVGARHGKPVVLQIDAAGMQAAGFIFYLSQNNVWLTELVPVRFLSFPPLS